MATPENAITKEDMAFALDIELARAFDQDADILAGILGVSTIETMPAGATLRQYKVTGSLNKADRAEGDEIPLSHFKEEAGDPITLVSKDYRKLTTKEAILKSGYEHAVTRTDDKAVKLVRKDILDEFYGYLKNGTGTATGKNLQAVLAQADAALDVALEENADSTEGKVYFVNRLDIADYLAEHNITLETVFGLQYLVGFLGLNGTVILTSAVPQGTVYVTAQENLRIFNQDFGALSMAGLDYEVSDSGLIGVHHEPDYKRASTETFITTGMTVFPEAVNYIIKGTIAPTA